MTVKTLVKKEGNFYNYGSVSAGEAISVTFDRPIKRMSTVGLVSVDSTGETPFYYFTGANTANNLEFPDIKGYPVTLYFKNVNTSAVNAAFKVLEYGTHVNEDYFSE